MKSALELVASVLAFAFGAQKIILDWADPSDMALGILCASVGYVLLRERWPYRWTRVDWALLLLSAAVYTGLDYLTGISGAPWHWWNRLPFYL